MDRKELAYAKQTILNVKDWDAFQAVIRQWANMLKLEALLTDSAKQLQ